MSNTIQFHRERVSKKLEMSSPKRKNNESEEPRKRSQSPRRLNTFDEMLKSLDDLMVIENSSENVVDDGDVVEREPRMLPEKRKIFPKPIKNMDSVQDILLSYDDLHNSINNINIVNEPESMDEQESMELEKSRKQLKVFMKEKQMADRKELAMVAENREKRALLDRIKKTGSQHQSQEVLMLMKSYDEDEILSYEFIKAVMKVLQDDKTITPTPEDFLDQVYYKEWKSEMDKSLQQVLIKLLKYRFVSPPPAVPQDGQPLQIQVCIYEADNLIPKEGRMRSAYCRVEIMDVQNGIRKKARKKFETDQISSLNPFWDQYVTVDVKLLSEVVCFEVKDKLKDDHFLGRVIIPFHEMITKVANGGRYDEWHDLQPRETKKKDLYVGGRLHIGAFIISDSASATVSFQKIQTSIEALYIDNRAIFDVLMRALITLGIHLPRNGRNELLTQESTLLLQIWAQTWQITNTYKLVSYLKTLFSFYDEKVSVFDLLIVFHCLYTHVKKEECNSDEMQLILNLLQEMRIRFCSAVINYKEFFPENQPPKALESTILILRMIHKFPKYLEHHPELKQSPKEELKQILTEAMISKFSRFRELTAPLDENNCEMVIEALKKLAEIINNEIQQDFKYYQTAFNQELDIVRLTAESLLKYFALVLEDSGQVLSTDEAVLGAADHVFQLYRIIRVMSARYDNFG